MKINKKHIGLIELILLIILYWTRFFVPDKYDWVLWIILIGFLLAVISGNIYFYKTQREAINVAMKPKYLISYLVFFLCAVGLSTILLIVVLFYMEPAAYTRTICTLIVIFSYVIIYLVFIQFKALSDHEIKLESLLSKKDKGNKLKVINREDNSHD